MLDPAGEPSAEDEELGVSCSPVGVACGPLHCAAADALGRLFTFGAGALGQLGHGPPLVDEHAPRLVRTLLHAGALRSDGTSGGVALPRQGATVACGQVSGAFRCFRFTRLTSCSRLSAAVAHVLRLGHGRTLHVGLGPLWAALGGEGCGA